VPGNEEELTDVILAEWPAEWSEHDQEDVEGSPDMPQDNTKDNLKAEIVVVAGDQNGW
jgi:hypothetical protein